MHPDDLWPFYVLNVSFSGFLRGAMASLRFSATSGLVYWRFPEVRICLESCAVA